MRAKKPREMEADLDMTTFINLMVVLLAFLLVTAVFTEVARLQVNLPAAGPGGSPADQNKPPIVLEVSIYKDQILVADQQTGPLKVFPATADGHDYKGLKQYLIELKEQYPGVTEALIMLEQDTPYDSLIHTMDAVRYKVRMVNGTAVKAALFPDMSIGNAIPRAGGTP